METNRNQPTGRTPVDTLVQRLATEREGGGGGVAPASVPDDPANRGRSPEEALDEALRQTPAGDAFEFDESVVKQNLDEILLSLIALRCEGTHGKALIEDLANLFGADLSPGTVYPRLHDIENEDVLEMYELVRTKEYAVADETAAKDRIETAMHQHLCLGLFLSAALEEL